MKSITRNWLRRGAVGALAASIATAGFTGFVTQQAASAAVVVPPAPSGGHSLFVFTDSDAIVGVNKANTPLRVDLIRAGTVIGTSRFTTDGAGNFQINHPAPPNSFCWSTPGTIDIAAGDIVQVTDPATGAIEGTQAQQVTVTPQVNAGSGDITVSGVARDAAGAPLPGPPFVEGRLQLKGGQHFAQTGTNSDRVGGVASSPGATLVQNPDGTFNATYHFSNGNDISLAMGATDLFAWMGRDGTGLTEKTIAEGAPAPPVCGAVVAYRATGNGPTTGYITAADVNGTAPAPFSVNGVSQDASSVTATLTDAAGASVSTTSTAIAPAAGSQTWTATFTPAQLAGLGQGTIAISETFTTAAGTTPGSNTSMVKDTVAPVAPTATPGAGTYTSTQSVTLNDVETGVAIRYTTDGTAPTATSPLFAAATPITVDVTKTIQAIAIDGAGNVSALSSFAYTIAPPPPPAPPATTASAPPARSGGYRLVASDGGIFAFGNAGYFGSMGGSHLNAPIITAAATPSGAGYWLVGADGGIFSFGDARFFGSTGGQLLTAPVVAMAPTPTGDGYWLVARDGGVFAFGNAGYFGSMGGSHLNAPIISMAATPDGKGYWLIAKDGGIFSFGNAAFFGSTGGRRLNQPVIAMAPTSTGQGYWLIARDGGIFTFGDARFFGSTGGMRLNAPIISMTAPSDGGYWLLAADGGIFTFGDARFFGSTGGMRLNAPIIGMV